MHIGKSRHLNICEVHGKMKKQDSRGLIRLYRWRILFPSSKTSYIEANTQKGEETDVFSTGRHSYAPNAESGGPDA
jgi:hypothetical protein